MSEHRSARVIGRISRLFQLRSVQVVVVIASFVALLAAVLPYGLAEGAKVWLREKGARQVSIGDVQFNLFTARFLVRAIHFDANPTEPVNVATLEGALSWANLSRGRILFDRILVQNANLLGSQTAEGTSWRVGGITLNELSAEKSPVSTSKPGIVGVRVLQIENSTATVVLPRGRFDIKIGSARLENLVPWAMNEPSTLDLVGEIAGAKVAIKGTASPFSLRPSAAVNLTSTRLPVSLLGLLVDTEKFSPQGLVSLGGKATVEFGGADMATAGYEGTVSGVNLSLQIPGEGTVQIGELSWKGGLSTGVGGEVWGQLDARAARLDLAGVRRISASELRLDNFRVGMSGSGSLPSFLIKDFQADSLSIDDMEKPRPSDFSAKVLRGGPMKFSSGDLQLRDIIAEGAQLRFVRRGSKLIGPNRLFGSNDTSTQETKAPGLKFRIARVRLAKSSGIKFRDENVAPNFAMDAQLDEFQVQNIDSHRPGLPAKFTVKANIDKYTKLEVSGDVAPFGPSLSGTIQVHAERIALPSLTPYLAHEAGYAFKSGVGDVQAKVMIDKGALNAETTVVLRGMEVEPMRPDAASAARASLTMPVDAVLSLLRDKNSDIKLKIPVTGDVSEPQFSFRGVFAKAASGAMKSASFGFLKYALQPFGAAIMVGELAQGLAASIRLDPIIFEAGTSKLNSRDMPFLDRIADIMEKRPGLRIKLCGMAIPDDRTALATRRRVAVASIPDKDLIDLVAARVAALMGELVRRRGISSSRIIACQATIDALPGALPRVVPLI